MKVILSRKGFDSTAGGYASPILPDGTMLSLPIPGDGNLLYSDICYNSVSYNSIIADISNNRFNKDYCHLDPDIRPDLRKEKPEKWEPAFGQCGASQTILDKAKVQEGDLFLFFGWFRKVKKSENGYRYMRKSDSDDFFDSADIQAVYGYLQIGKIIKDKDEIRKFSWHPHSADSYNTENFNNAIYIPTDKLSFAPDLPGYGTFRYDKKFVLTAENQTRSNWTYRDFLTKICNSSRKNCAKDKVNHIQYRGIWQELVLEENPELEEWVKSLFE